MEELEQELFDLTKNYFDLMDEEISDEFLMSLVRSIIDYYKTMRNYPESYTDEAIETDALRYFKNRKNNIAMDIIPEMYGRIGAEGLSMLTDNGITRMWKNSTILHDVTPLCEVV